MKCSKSAIHRKTHRIPEIKFEDQRLTSFAGLVVYQSLFSRIRLKQQLSGCFRHLTVWVANYYSCSNLGLPGFCPVELCTVVLSRSSPSNRPEFGVIY